MFHSKTSRLLKTNASIHNIDLALSKRTLPKNSNLPTEKMYTRKLSSPQKQLKNWCKIQQSILHNIYDLKQLKPDQDEYATVNRYEELLIKINELERKIENEKREYITLRESVMMSSEDQNSRTVRNMNMISEMEELEEIVEVYIHKFPEEARILFPLLELQLDVSVQARRLLSLQSELDDLTQALPVSAPNPTPPSTTHLTHRIQAYRLQLLELEQQLNQFCESSGKPLMRQILCQFYIQNKDTNTDEEIGIELWVCKNSLVNTLDKYVFANYKYMKEGCYKQYLEFLQMLTKIEMNFVEIERLTTISEVDCAENILCAQKKMECLELKDKLMELEERKKKLEQELNQLLSNQQLFKLRCDMEKYDTKIVLKEIKIEQSKRLNNMRMIRGRQVEIEKCFDKFNPQQTNINLLNQLKQTLIQKQKHISSLTHQLEELHDQKTKRETRFSFSRIRIQKSPEQLDEEIQALEKKLSKLQEKKLNIINSKFHQTPKCEKPSIGEINPDMISPILSNKKKKPRPSSKSASKISKAPTAYHTISIRPYQPLDKAINRLVSFKKTLANDKLKLNKQMSKLMRNI